MVNNPEIFRQNLTKKYYLVISQKNAETQGLSIPAELKEEADQIL